MTKSIRSVYLVIRLDFAGNDVGNTAINDALSEMDYNFTYEDDYVRIVNSELVESLWEYNS